MIRLYTLLYVRALRNGVGTANFEKEHGKENIRKKNNMRKGDCT